MVHGQRLPRQLVLGFFAVVMVVTPFLMASWFGLCPQYGDPACPGTARPQDYLPAVRSAPSSLLQIFLVLNLLVPYVFPLGFIGMALATWRRSPWLTAVGLACGWIGSIAWGFIADELFVWTFMAGAHHDAIFAALLRTDVADWHILAVGSGWVIGHLVAYLLLGIALLRTRAVPRWSALLIIAAVPIMGPFAYGFKQNALQLLGYLMVATGCIPAAQSIISQPDRSPTTVARA